MSLNINHYINDGFVKVCKVQQECQTRNFWSYYDQNTSILYSPHKSWVYAICVDDQIYKIGESGNPLGIRSSTGFQPVTGTKSRLGRYMRNDGTDEYIRNNLMTEVKQDRVSFWARKCDNYIVETVIAGSIEETLTSTHKELEMKYLDYIKQTVGRYPILNKARK
jgi:hypothetical protein